jgi:hypothetical protein
MQIWRDSLSPSRFRLGGKRADVLKLTALDAEDLAVISAQMQDAVLRVGDIAYTPKRKQFALVANRFAWDDAQHSQRRRTGLHFGRVTGVQTLKIKRSEPDVILSLLSIGFVETDAPSGEIVLTFSGGATFRLTVECIEASLRDLGPAWETRHRPSHGDEG